MPKLYRNGIIVLAVLLLFGSAIWPLEKNLRRGKDLAGGVTLVYNVQIAPGENASQVMDKTIEVIKERVDPQGVMEISIVRQGADRIEISMPLPSDEVKALKKKRDEALAELGRNTITAARLERAVQAGEGAREQQFRAMVGNDVARTELLNNAAAAWDKAKSLRGELATLTDAAARDAKASEVADAELTYEAARQSVLQTVVSAEDVKRILGLSTKARTLLDSSNNQVRTIPSPRDQALERLYKEHGGAKDQVERILKLHEDYSAARTTLDDPDDLVRMLKGAGVLTYRITCDPGEHPDEPRLRQEIRERGPRNVRSTDAHWFKVNDISTWYNDVADFELLQSDPVNFFRARRGMVAEVYDGEYYVLAWDTRQTRLTPAEGDWSVAAAFPTHDQLGRPAIGFRMDPRGSKLLGNLTRDHVGKKMAVLLDDQVYTAPNLKGAISRDGIIEGDFPQQEIDYIVRVLSAGSLKAKLSSDPLSRDSVGPELGADNLRKGLVAGLIALVVIGGFMIVYYFGAGLVAVVALGCTALLILGAMAFNHAAFTMAGIAGVVLTFGMAVDANVLIYERMREEMRHGHDLKTAVRLGFSKALSSIVDGNITTLIVCVVLASKQVSTPEIRGFGITMGIGVLATLFSGLFLSRFIFDVMVHVVGVRKLNMLPMAIPAIQRVLTPNIDWMGLRWLFIGLSSTYMLLGLGMAGYRGKDMLDTQFRGGTAVTLEFKRGEGEQRLTMTRAQVEQRVHTIPDHVASTDPLRGTLETLAKATVSPINPREDGVSSDKFKITAYTQNPDPVVRALVQTFGDVLDVPPALQFRAAVKDLKALQDPTGLRRAPVFTIEKPGPLGPNIERAGVTVPTTAYVGGAAIVLDQINPPQRIEDIRARLQKLREGPDYSDTLSRAHDVFVIEGDESAATGVAVVVRDESYSPFDDPDKFETEVKLREWGLVNQALASEASPASVQSVGPTVAADFTARAIAATIISFLGITIYIWVRFKSFSYSFAALVALVHDVLTVLGLVALSGWLVENPSTSKFATSIGLLPFRLDLNLVAAMLTVAGYSLNDTVIVMDRIREYRGKMRFASRAMINNAINHTISRTLITSGTTLVASFILFIAGGEGVRAFSFALLTGIAVGTYSSVAVASPLVWSRRGDREEAEEIARGGAKLFHGS